MNMHHLPSSSITERSRDSIPVVQGGVRAINDSEGQSGTPLRSQTIHPARDRAKLAVTAHVRAQADTRTRALLQMKLASSAVFKVQIAAEVPA